MARRPHDLPYKGIRKYKKSHILLVSLLLVMTIGVGATVAFLMDSTNALVNIFNPSYVTSEVNEVSFDGVTKTGVTVKNTGNIEAYIRAAIVVTWKNAENGDVYGSKPVAGTDYTISLNGTDWFLGSDGYYYHKAPVAAGDPTAVLINSCSPVADKTPTGYGLNVEILGSAIQSVPTSVVTSMWGVTLDSDGNIAGGNT